MEIHLNNVSGFAAVALIFMLSRKPKRRDKVKYGYLKKLGK